MDEERVFLCCDFPIPTSVKLEAYTTTTTTPAAAAKIRLQRKLTNQLKMHSIHARARANLYKRLSEMHFRKNNIQID